MSNHEFVDPRDAMDAVVIRRPSLAERMEAHGIYTFRCFGADGVLKWEDYFVDNVVCTLGKNLNFNTFFAGSSYTVTGPFLGLISAVGFSAVNAADTMASHAGWVEAGNANNPTYTGTRKTAVFAAASGGSIALSASLTFAITSSGQSVQGGFLTLGSGAVNTVDSTAGTLWSAGAFSGGAKAVDSGDSLVVSYSCSM